MADILIAELVPNPKNKGGTYVTAPWRFVFHMTQTARGKGAAKRLARLHANPPSVWYDWEYDELVQSVPLNRSAFALFHPAGTPETNKMRAIQCELLGYSELAADLPDWALERIGQRVLRPAHDALLAAYGSTFDLSAPLATRGSDGYGVNAPQRMTRSQWARFNAVCAHQHVCDNSHWDCGRLNMARICEHARGTTPEQPEPVKEWDEMASREDVREAAKEGAAEAISEGKLATEANILTGVQSVTGSGIVTLGEKTTNLGDVVNILLGLNPSVQLTDEQLDQLAVTLRAGLGEEVADVFGRKLLK